MDEIVVLVTAMDEDEAAKIATELVRERLAACVNIIPKVRSIYRWQGAVEDSTEAMMLIKTRRDLFEPMAACVKRNHSYSVPEIMAVPIVEGSLDYLSWLRKETGQA